jgi:hypothetical protein
MKTPRIVIVLLLLLLQLTLAAQVLWYQNQDGACQPPNGTTGTTVQSFTKNSFVACYQWNITNDQYTWKISKSHINGTEQRCFFITGTTALVEVKPGHHKSLFVLERSFPLGQNPEYIVYKLDTNLNIKAQKSISFPNNFSIFSLNAFEVDEDDNVYLAGDGQYPDGPGYSPASFVMKTDKYLQTKWKRMDSVQTSYTRLHVDRWNYVWVIADYYDAFPNVYVKKISPNGHQVQTRTFTTDPGRFTLYSTLDKDDNLLFYGVKSVTDSTQAVYLSKVSRSTGAVLYNRTHFTSPGTQLHELKVDPHGNIFSLITQYLGPDHQVSKISRIKPSNGTILWNRNFNYAQDSNNLYKLILNDDSRFFVIGERRSNNYFSKGVALRIKKVNGQSDNQSIGPDSVVYQRSHWLVDGILDREDQLIAIGNTMDLDTTTYLNTYLRSFAVRFGENNECGDHVTAVARPNVEEIAMSNKLVLFPNPVENLLSVSSSLSPELYGRISVYNMQGVELLQQSVNGTMARIDVSALPNGAYLVVFKSAITFKEERSKFIVKK